LTNFLKGYLSWLHHLTPSPRLALISTASQLLLNWPLVKLAMPVWVLF
jgi:hypothetical protein